MEWKDLTHVPSTAHQPPTHIPSTAHQPPTHVPSTFNQRPINVGRTWIKCGWDVGRRLTSHPRPIHVLPTFQLMFTYVPSTSYPTRTQHLSSHSSSTHLLSASYPIHPRFHLSPTHATSWCVPIHLVPIFHQLQFSLIPPPAHALSSSHPPTFHPLLLFCGNIEKYSSLRDNEIYQLITVIRKDWLLLFPSFPTFLPLNHA